MHKPPKKKFVFEIGSTTDIPRRIGRGQDGDPIYAPISKRGWLACKKYFDKIQQFLDHGAAEPTLKSVAEAVPHGSVLTISVESENHDVFGPKALVTIKDDDRRGETRSPRFFDPVYVVAFLMLTSPGGSLRYNDTKGKMDSKGRPTRLEDRRLFLAFGRGAEQNIRVLRIIADASRGQQVHRSHSKLDPQFHYDHRKSALLARLDDTVRKSGQFAGASRKGRSAAIRTAGIHYETAAKLRGPESVRHIAKDRAEFERELKRVFSLADAYHKELVKRRRTKSRG